ncbi:MAG: diguanylate cyclase [Herminiimonas sp.]|nr:diguanylate cyclase [Herminiimonas sp.]
MTDSALKIERSLREEHARLSLAVEGSGTGIWDRNVVTGEIHYSPGWKALFGYEANDISNRIEDSYQRLHPDDLAYVQSSIQAHFDRQSDSYVVEHRLRCKDGSYKWVSSRGKVTERDQDGRALRMIGTTTDVTAIHELSEKLQKSVDLITNLTNEVPGFLFQYRCTPNGDTAFSYASEGVRDIYELAPDQILACAAVIEEHIHADDLDSYRASLASSSAGLVPWHLEYRVQLPRQGLRWRQGDARPRRVADGTVEWHGFISDVTKRKQGEIELQEFATVDFLTRLPNRRYFMERMESEFLHVQRDGATRTTVIMCDLDHFKLVNDRFGHATGDRVLQHFASILQQAVRANDTIGRIGGEEFAVVVSDAGAAEALAVAQRVQQLIAETPLMQEGELLSITVSIGIAAMNARDENAAAALSRSDIALYRAKALGRNRIEVGVD